jgi:hypothetical protein
VRLPVVCTGSLRRRNPSCNNVLRSCNMWHRGKHKHSSNLSGMGTRRLTRQSWNRRPPCALR